MIASLLFQGLAQAHTAAHRAPTDPSADIPPVQALDKPRFWHTLGADFQLDLITFLHRDLPKIIFVILFTWLLIWLLSLAAKRLTRFGDGSMNKGHGAQIKTLASVVKASGYGILLFHALIEILEIFNVNVTPLLASAGVAGVAIGFGAQTLVKDVINGVLLLVENQLNVGDVVTAAGNTGTVEEITLRRVVLRNGDTGAIYIIPNSQITTVTNLTRNVSKVIVTIPADNAADPDKVIAVLKRVAQDVAADPAYAAKMRNPPEIVGVDKVDGAAMLFPVVFTADVNQQWGMSRDFRRRVVLAFQEEGIDFAGFSRVQSIAAQAAQAEQNAAQPNASAALDATPGAKPS